MHKTKLMLKKEVLLHGLLEDKLPDTFNRLGGMDLVAKELNIRENTLWSWVWRLDLEIYKIMGKRGMEVSLVRKVAK